MPIYDKKAYYFEILLERGIDMGYWVIPFIGLTIFILCALSLIVVEYQDQKARQFKNFRNFS